MPSKALRYACAICGRPCVPLDDASIQRSFAELPDLQRANRARIMRLVWRISTGSTALLALSILLSGAVLALAIGLPTLALALLGICIALPSAFAIFSFSRARKNGLLLDEALDDAWLKVATELTRARSSVDGGEIAAAMRLDEDAAQELAVKISTRELLLEAQDPWSLLEQKLEGRVRVEGLALADELPDDDAGGHASSTQRREQ